MDIINIDRDVFDSMMVAFGEFKRQMIALCEKHRSKGLDEWLDNQDVCLLLGVSQRTLQSYRDRGRIGFSQINHKVYYRVSDIEGFLLSCKGYGVSSDSNTNTTKGSCNINGGNSYNGMSNLNNKG